MSNVANSQTPLKLYPVLKTEQSDYFATYRGEYIGLLQAGYHLGDGVIVETPSAALKLNKTMNLLEATGNMVLANYGFIGTCDVVDKVVFDKIHYLDDDEVKTLESTEFSVENLKSADPSNQRCLLTTEWGVIETNLNPQTGGFEAVTDSQFIVGISLRIQRVDPNRRPR